MVNKDLRPLVHVGFAKCASTSLQRELFMKLPNTSYLGVGMDAKDDRVAQNALTALYKIVTLSERDYRDEAQSIEKAIAIFAKTKELHIVSHEFFSSGNYCPYEPDTCTDVSLVARRLHSLLPHARILMIIRNQLTILPSIFSQAIKSPMNNYSWRQYIDTAISDARKGRGSALHRVNYYQAYRDYAEVFGPDNITVIPLETLMKDKANVFARVARLSGVLNFSNILNYSHSKSNVRQSYLEILVYNNRKMLNRILGLLPRNIRECFLTTYHFLANHSPLPKYEFIDDQHSFLSSFYAHGNKMLSEATDLNLKDLGYPY